MPLRQSSAAARRYRKSRQIIPWSPDFEIVRRDRPFIPWEASVGTQFPGGHWGRYNYAHPVHESGDTGIITTEGAMVIGAIAIAVIGIYFWITKSPKLPEPQ